MNVQQTMEDVMQPLEHVQIQLEVALVLAKLVIQEMVSLVMVKKKIIFFIEKKKNNQINKRYK